jgi:hypothetical protein
MEEQARAKATFSRVGCAFALAFGREEKALRQGFDAGLKPRSISRAKTGLPTQEQKRELPIQKGKS